MPSASRDTLEGEDFTCGYRGCEIMLKRNGDPAKMDSGSSFTCRGGMTVRQDRLPMKRDAGERHRTGTARRDEVVKPTSSIIVVTGSNGRIGDAVMRPFARRAAC